MVPLLLIIGIVVTLTGCVSPNSDEDTNVNSSVQEVVKEKDDSQIDGIRDEVSTEKESAATEDKTTSVAPNSTKNNSITKPDPVKKTDTSGTTAQVPVTLVKAIDGDTIKVLYNGEEKNVRYLLIDTPETSHPRLGKQPFGEEAKERNQQLVNSGSLTLEFDVGERLDKYDRLLAYVYVDGKSVQQTLLAEGLARVAYVYPPNTRHLTPFEEIQSTAKKKGLGIWSVENYATDSGFDSSVVDSKHSTGTSGSVSKPSNNPTTQPSTSTDSSGSQEWFQNCTELRKKYPNGVPKGHAAYQAKMDRDKDDFACEK